MTHASLPPSRCPVPLPRAQPIDAKKCAMDKGYTLLDIRSTQEHNAASKKWFVSMPFDSESSFKSAFTAAFPMKSARIVLACDDGSDRTSAAAGVLASLGYTNVNTVEGGVNAYLRFDPLTSKDKASGGAAAAYKPAAAAATSRFSLSDRSSPSPSVSSGKYAMVKVRGEDRMGGGGKGGWVQAGSSG